MKTLVIYDDNGVILATYIGREDTPTGVNYLIVDVPIDYNLVSIDVSVPDNPTPIYEYQKGSTESKLIETVEQLSEQNRLLTNSNIELKEELTESEKVVSSILGM